jgi:glycine cleavage system regulatory protein
VKRLRITMSACDVAILTSRITGIARDVAFLTMRITGSAHDVAIVPMCFRDAHGQKDRLSGSTPARGDRLP